MQSTASTQSPNDVDSYTFDLMFRDFCSDETLNACALVQSTFTVDLWDVQQLVFQEMSLAGGTDCGGFTYELEYVSGDKASDNPDLTAIYTVEDHATPG